MLFGQRKKIGIFFKKKFVKKASWLGAFISLRVIFEKFIITPI